MLTWLCLVLKSSGAVGAKVSTRQAHLEAPGERGDRHVVQYWCVTAETAEGAAKARACLGLRSVHGRVPEVGELSRDAQRIRAHRLGPGELAAAIRRVRVTISARLARWAAGSRIIVLLPYNPSRWSLGSISQNLQLPLVSKAGSGSGRAWQVLSVEVLRRTREAVDVYLEFASRSMAADFVRTHDGRNYSSELENAQRIPQYAKDRFGIVLPELSRPPAAPTPALKTAPNPGVAGGFGGSLAGPARSVPTRGENSGRAPLNGKEVAGGPGVCPPACATPPAPLGHTPDGASSPSGMGKGPARTGGGDSGGCAAPPALDLRTSQHRTGDRNCARPVAALLSGGDNAAAKGGVGTAQITRRMLLRKGDGGQETRPHPSVFWADGGSGGAVEGQTRSTPPRGKSGVPTGIGKADTGGPRARAVAVSAPPARPGHSPEDAPPSTRMGRGTSRIVAGAAPGPHPRGHTWAEIVASHTADPRATQQRHGSTSRVLPAPAMPSGGRKAAAGREIGAAGSRDLPRSDGPLPLALSGVAQAHAGGAGQ